MDLAREWFTVAELPALQLPGLPTVAANIRALAERDRWRRADQVGKQWRARKDRGGGIEYHYTVLPPAARQVWITAFAATGGAAQWEAAKAAGAVDAGLWSAYWSSSQTARDKADRNHRIVTAVDIAIRSGRSRTLAVAEAVAEYDISQSRLYDLLALVKGLPPADWVPALLPRAKGQPKGAECSDEAWQALYTEYARLERPNFSDCFYKIKKVAAANGWKLPSQATLWRRMQAVDQAGLTRARYGSQALKQKFPAQERDRTVFHALQAVNADGHKWDVMVRWPDGRVHRPMMVGFQDLYSDMFLSWRIDTTENKYLIQLAFGDVVETYGIPELCYLDNGRGFTAKSLTGGIRNRFRYRYREAEPDGIMKQLGVSVHFTLPYSGQSKPIERGFGDLARRVAKDIRFQQAYVGNCPDARPEDFDAKKAVPLDDFLKVVAEGIADHNQREGRRTKVCGPTKCSFQQAFTKSYENSIIRKASPQHKQLWMLAAEQIKPRRIDSSIHFYGNRYWAKFLEQHVGETVTVRFDPDHLHDDLHVYSAAGNLIGQAKCLEAVGYNNVEAAKTRARELAAYRRNARENDAIERGGMTVPRLIELTQQPLEDAPAPRAKVVRLVQHGSAAVAMQPLSDEEREEFEANYHRSVQQMRAQRGPFWVVEGAGDD